MAGPISAGMTPPTSFIQGPKTPSPFHTVTSAIYHKVCLYPHTIAAIDLTGVTRREVTYAEFEQRARLLARELREQGVKPRDRVPLVVKRSVEMLVGIYAILLCGAQYIPLDGNVVAEKTLETVITQSGKRLAVCLDSTKRRFENSESPIVGSCKLITINNQVDGGVVGLTDNFVDLAAADSGCYVIYTSGALYTPLHITSKEILQILGANLTKQVPQGNQKGLM